MTTATATGTSAWKRWAARHHPLVWWLVAIKVTAALAFTLLIPFFRGPDEIDHYSTLRWHAINPGYPIPTQFLFVEPSLLATGVPRDRATGEWPPMLTEDAVARPDRPTLAELEVDAVPEANPTNQLSQHPPLFYTLTEGTLGVFMGMTPDWVWSWDRLGLAYRWASVLAAGLLPLVASAAALAGGLNRRQAAVAAAFAFLIPQHTYIGAVINNDSFTTLFAGVAVAAALGWLRRPGSWRWALGAAAAAGVAASSKSTGLSALVWVIALGGLGLVRALGTPGLFRQRLAVWLGAVGVGVVGVSWQLTQWARFRDIQPSGYSTARREGIDPTWGDFVYQWITKVGSSFWGAPAARSGVALPAWVVVAASVVTLGLVAVAVVAPWLRRRGRTVPTALLGLVVLQVALMLNTNQRGFFRTERVNAFQGRYLFVVLVPLAVLVTLGVVEVLRRVKGRPDPLGVAVAFAAVGVVIHAMLAVTMVTNFWGPPGGSWGAHLEAVVAWSPLPAVLTTVVLVAPVVVTLGGVGWWAVRRRAGADTPPSRDAEELSSSSGRSAEGSIRSGGQ